MSLLTEQKIINFKFTEREPEIFTTGAKLVPMEVNVNGIIKYVWVVKEFMDDSFSNGDLCNPVTFANSIKNLISYE